jgi:hypothetical protein
VGRKRNLEKHNLAAELAGPSSASTEANSMRDVAGDSGVLNVTIISSSNLDKTKSLCLASRGSEKAKRLSAMESLFAFL